MIEEENGSRPPKNLEEDLINRIYDLHNNMSDYNDAEYRANFMQEAVSVIRDFNLNNPLK